MTIITLSKVVPTKHENSILSELVRVQPSQTVTIGVIRRRLYTHDDDTSYVLYQVIC